MAVPKTIKTAKPVDTKKSPSSTKIIENVRELEKQVHDSPKFLNNIVSLLEYAKGRDTEIIYASIHSLQRIFAVYVDRGQIDFPAKSKLPVANQELSPEQTVNKWLADQYSQFAQQLVRIISNSDLALQIASLRLILQVIQKQTNASSLTAERYTFCEYLYTKLVRAIITHHQLKDDFVNVLLNSYLSAYGDLRYHFIKSTLQYIRKDMPASDKVGFRTGDLPKMSYNTQCLINNVFRILPNIKNLAVVDGTVTEFWANDPATLVKEPANPRKRRKVAGATDQEGPEPVDPVQRSSEHTKTFENLWVAYLGLPLSLDLYKQILLLMHKRIIPYMHYPPALSDFLTRAYAQGGVVSVLALNSLFTLMQEHNLTYADFYLKLYALFDRQLFHVKYRSRFLRMASLFLASTHLPSYIIAAFAKRMARLALDAPPAALLVVLPWIYNLLKAHASCMPLIHRVPGNAQSDKAEETDAKAKPKSTPTVNKWMASDPYDHTAADPKEAKALESSLWEIQTLQSHYAPQVSTMAKVFSDRFTRNPFDLEDFLDHTYSTLFSAELDRPSHKDPALAAQIPPRLFIEGDTYHDLWDLS